MRARTVSVFALGFAVGVVCLGLGLWLAGAFRTAPEPVATARAAPTRESTPAKTPQAESKVPPPAPRIEASANWADPAKVVAESTSGAATPMRRDSEIPGVDRHEFEIAALGDLAEKKRSGPCESFVSRTQVPPWPNGLAKK